MLERGCFLRKNKLDVSTFDPFDTLGISFSLSAGCIQIQMDKISSRAHLGVTPAMIIHLMCCARWVWMGAESWALDLRRCVLLYAARQQWKARDGAAARLLIKSSKVETFLNQKSRTAPAFSIYERTHLARGVSLLSALIICATTWVRSTLQRIYKLWSRIPLCSVTA